MFTALLFTIRIGDIDKNIVKSIVRSFINDARVNKQISNEVDVKEIKEDLKIYVDGQMKIDLHLMMGSLNRWCMTNNGCRQKII